MRKIILCADDYALTPEVSAGIFELAQQGRLSAVGCMTEAPFWQDRANQLATLRDHIDIGLHFNLTQGFGASHSASKLPLKTILRNALLGKITESDIASTLHDQLDRFESVMGEAPDFVDGHEHVHMLPHIRRVVLEALSRRYRLRRPWLRCVNPRLKAGPDWTKRLILDVLGAGFKSAAEHRGFALNPAFAGIYSLRPDANFAARMRIWLSEATDGELLMCHPGNTATPQSHQTALLQPADGIAATRPLEFAYLAGEEFAELLRTQQIALVRFHDLQIQSTNKSN